MKENLFTNEKETRRAIQAAVDKYNDVFRAQSKQQFSTCVDHSSGFGVQPQTAQ